MKKSLALFVPLCVLLIYIFSCGKENSSEPNYNATISTQWEFKEGSNNYGGTIDSAFMQAGSSGANVAVTGRSSDKTGLILFAIENFDTTKPATYQVNHVGFTYMKNNAIIYQSDTGNFQIIITKISATSISGTFSGTVKDPFGARKQIRDGRFTLTLKSNIPPPPAAKDSGWVSFWAKGNPNGGGPIKVRINDKTETISVFTSSAPADCQTAGTARFKVPVGTYTWVAASNTQDSVKGTVTVSKGGCERKEVVLQQTGPVMGQVEFWAKNSCTEGGSIRIKIDGKDEKSITTFTSTEPSDCSLSGCATFSLLPGEHSYKAYCGKSDSMEGKITITANQCIKKQVTFTVAAAKFELTATSCSSATFQGSYYTGVALTSANAVTISVNVISPGTYTITTGKSNGISFSGSGTFTTTGVQQITLYGLGTPGNDAMANVPIEVGTSRCSLQIAVSAPPPTSGSWSFTEGGVTYSGTFGRYNSFGDDLVSGKVMTLYGSASTADTTFRINVHFNGSPSQPVPGNYVSEPNSFAINSTEVTMYTDLPPNAKYIYYEKCGTCALSNLKITVTISSYDAATKTVAGTFSGNGWNKKGDVVTISNGKFKATL
ncbi:hypothetical protein [Pinibacter soli]|uniref:Uncharacterized protein n=1 Tax=Pinibacter soli TaxID=3044211 RepID=A0ABT6RJT4_9BACT|nr:hypothetical protein [Pinibacter soli]MDI3322112.1 hypothetical protein [Pinibacter soli]